MAKAKGIFKRGQVYWIRYAGVDGKTVRESTKSARHDDAEELLLQRKREGRDQRKGIMPAPITEIQNCTFRELAEKYKQWMKGRHKSAHSKKYRIDTMILQFGGLPLRQFNTMTVEHYQTELLNKKRHIKSKDVTIGLKPASINKNVNLFKAMIKKAVDWGLCDERVLKQMRRCKSLTENNGRLRYLSTKECQELIDSCAPHLKPIVITALNTGMRKSEILSLKWENIDLKHGFIHIEKSKNGDRREIPISDTLRQTLKGMTRRLDVDYVFHSGGKTYGDVKRSWHTAMRRVKIYDFRFHDMRHTFASHLVMAGVDLTTVSRLLGHKDIKMTLRYSHLAPEHMKSAIDTLDTVLSEGRTAQKLHTQAL